MIYYKNYEEKGKSFENLQDIKRNMAAQFTTISKGKFLKCFN